MLGWGAEIASIVADEAFWDLDGPVVRITTPHIPLPSASRPRGRGHPQRRPCGGHGPGDGRGDPGGLPRAGSDGEPDGGAPPPAPASTWSFTTAPSSGPEAFVAEHGGRRSRVAGGGGGHRRRRSSRCWRTGTSSPRCSSGRTACWKPWRPGAVGVDMGTSGPARRRRGASPGGRRRRRSRRRPGVGEHAGGRGGDAADHGGRCDRRWHGGRAPFWRRWASRCTSGRREQGRPSSWR